MQHILQSYEIKNTLRFKKIKKYIHFFPRWKVVNKFILLGKKSRDFFFPRKTYSDNNVIFIEKWSILGHFFSPPGENYFSSRKKSHLMKVVIRPFISSCSVEVRVGISEEHSSVEMTTFPPFPVCSFVFFKQWL